MVEKRMRLKLKEEWSRDYPYVDHTIIQRFSRRDVHTRSFWRSDHQQLNRRSEDKCEFGSFVAFIQSFMTFLFSSTNLEPQFSTADSLIQIRAQVNEPIDGATKWIIDTKGSEEKFFCHCNAGVREGTFQPTLQPKGSIQCQGSYSCIRFEGLRAVNNKWVRDKYHTHEDHMNHPQHTLVRIWKLVVAVKHWVIYIRA